MTARLFKAVPPPLCAGSSGKAHRDMFLRSLRKGLRRFVVLPVRRISRRRIPVVMITGTKGKTTTVRMLAHLLAGAGHKVGFCSTDGVFIAGTQLTNFDSAGYRGAAQVLGDPRISAAVLEVARGDLLRRGRFLDRCEAAALLNLGREQIGIDGIETLEEMASLKRLVTDAARQAVVLNADDPLCLRVAQRYPAERLTLFSWSLDAPAVRDHLSRGGRVVGLKSLRGEEFIVKRCGDREEMVLPVASLPVTCGGVARHHLANALAAAALADGLGLSLPVIAEGLASFTPSVEQLPARFNVLTEFAFTVVLDLAINPPAAAALVAGLSRMPVTGRRLCMLTTVGNRPAWHYRELAELFAPCFDRFVCFEQEGYRRQRAVGEIAALLSAELQQAGVAAGRITTAGDDETALRQLLVEVAANDLLVILGGRVERCLAVLRGGEGAEGFGSGQGSTGTTAGA